MTRLIPEIREKDGGRHGLTIRGFEHFDCRIVRPVDSVIALRDLAQAPRSEELQAAIFVDGAVVAYGEKKYDDASKESQ